MKNRGEKIPTVSFYLDRKTYQALKEKAKDGSVNKHAKAIVLGDGDDEMLQSKSSDGTTLDDVVGKIYQKILTDPIFMDNLAKILLSKIDMGRYQPNPIEYSDNLNSFFDDTLNYIHQIFQEIRIDLKELNNEILKWKEIQEKLKQEIEAD